MMLYISWAAGRLVGRDKGHGRKESASSGLPVCGVCHVSQAHDHGDRFGVARPRDGCRALSFDAGPIAPGPRSINLFHAISVEMVIRHCR